MDSNDAANPEPDAMMRSRPPRHRVLMALVLLLAAPAAMAQDLRYSAQLQDGGRPANGRYDLRIDGYAGAGADDPAITTYLFDDVAIVDGHVELELASLPADADPQALWFGLSVRDADQAANHIPVPGRQQIVTPTVIGQCWSSVGDTGSDPDTNFLGTIDDTDLVLRTANVQSLRIEPTILNVPTPLAITASMIAGSSANAAVGDVRGVSIGGGGSVPHPGNPDTTFFGILADGNKAFSNYTTIAGGYANAAGTSSGQGTFATVGGGAASRATGSSSVVAGGFANAAQGGSSTVSGGSFNCAGGDTSWAGGRRAKVRPGNGVGASECTANSADGNGDEGTFVWADSTNADFVSNGGNRLLMRASGGVVMQTAISAETTARAPRGYFNVVRGDSGTAQPASPSATILASFENDSDAFVSVVAPASVNRGLVFADPGSASRGGLVYIGVDNSLQFLANGSARMTLRSDGRLHLPTLAAAGSTALCRNASNEISTCSSSLRYKDAIEPLALGLGTIEALRAVQYQWTADGMADIGFVAEEVAALDERLITRNAAGEVEGVKYDRISAVLAAAVQTLSEREQQQRSELDELKNRLARLESQLADR